MIDDKELESGVQIGDFRVERRLGAGGMGIVYLARQVTLGRLVALKVLGQALNRAADIARFQREAKAVALLHHPGIVGVHFIGQDRQICYIAMEYIEGFSLRQIIERLAAIEQSGQTLDAVIRTTSEGESQAPELRFDGETGSFAAEANPGSTLADSDSITPDAERLLATPAYIRRCIELVRDAATALAHAHDRKVIHRDIKPENILLDRQGSVHLIDFGLARFFEDVTVTNTGALVGTPMYMSPEQITGRITVDHRTDVYSLALVLYELLTLRRPITSPTREGVLRQVVTKPLYPLSSLNRAVPASVEAVIHKATSKDPDERYDTAAGLEADLQRYLDGKPVEASPYRYRLDRKEIAAERPGSVILSAALFFLIGVISTFAGIYNLYIWVLITYLPGAFPDSRVAWYDPVFVLGYSTACFLAASGVMSGLGWARVAGFVLSIVGVVYTLNSSYATYNRIDFPDVRTPLSISFYFLFYFPNIIAILTFSFASSMLLTSKARDWFRFAKRIRTEHVRRSISLAKTGRRSHS